MFVQDKTFQLSRSPDRNASHIYFSPSPVRAAPSTYCQASIDLSTYSSMKATSPLPSLPYKHTVHYRTGSTFGNPRNFSKQGKRGDFSGSFLDIHKYIDTGLSSLTKHKARQQAELRKLLDKHATEIEKLEIRKAKTALACSLFVKYGVRLSPLQLAKYSHAKLTEIALNRYNANLRRNAALKIQKHWGNFRYKQALRAEERKKDMAAAYIQAHWKGYKVNSIQQRHLHLEVMAIRTRAAVEIQRYARGFL